MFYGSIAQMNMKYAELSQIRKLGKISSWLVKVGKFYFESEEIDILKKCCRKLNS